MYGLHEAKSERLDLIRRGYLLAKEGYVILEESKKGLVFVNNNTGEEVEFLDPQGGDME